MRQDYLETTVDKFIFRVRVGCLYSETGVWVGMNETSGVARLGLSDYTQQSSGDVAFVSLPVLGHQVVAGKELATVETIKVDLEVQAPFDGAIVAVNEALEDAPELINLDPYGRGWLVEVRPAQWPMSGLLDAAHYLAVMTSNIDDTQILADTLKFHGHRCWASVAGVRVGLAALRTLDVKRSGGTRAAGCWPSSAGAMILGERIFRLPRLEARLCLPARRSHHPPLR